MKTESRIRHGKLGVTTIDGIAGKARSIAQILPLRSTKSAFAIGPTKPGNANAIANFKLRIYFFSNLFHMANNLVTWYERQFGIR